MQLDTTKCNGFPTVATQPVLTNTIQQGVLQQNTLMVWYYVCLCFI